MTIEEIQKLGMKVGECERALLEYECFVRQIMKLLATVGGVIGNFTNEELYAYHCMAEQRDLAYHRLRTLERELLSEEGV